MNFSLKSLVSHGFTLVSADKDYASSPASSNKGYAFTSINTKSSTSFPITDLYISKAVL